jgi:hypothetical protein
LPLQAQTKEPTMTTDHILSRPFAAMSVIFTLATGIALTAAPATARAETGNQIIMSDGTIDCPPCRFFQVHDEDGMSFRNVVAEMLDEDEVVVTAEVTVTGVGGKARTGSIVFSAFRDHSDDSAFMDYTDDACLPSLISRQAGAEACAAISLALRDASLAAATAPAAPSTLPSTPAPGIIMRDGGVCDPIRHMGC